MSEQMHPELIQALHEVDDEVKKKYPQLKPKIDELVNTIEQDFGWTDLMRNPNYRKAILEKFCQWAKLSQGLVDFTKSGIY